MPYSIKIGLGSFFVYVFGHRKMVGSQVPCGIYKMSPALLLFTRSAIHSSNVESSYKTLYMSAQVFLSDAILIEHIEEGNQAALEQLYNHYSRQLYANIFKLVKSETVAQELLQDVFVKLWLKRETLQVTNLASYLYAMSANAVYDYFRKERTNPVFIDNIIVASTQHYNHVEEIIFCRETSSRIQEALAKLPAKRRQVFELCKVEGKSYAEVSAMLGISISTISNQIVQATKDLRKYLDDE